MEMLLRKSLHFSPKRKIFTIMKTHKQKYALFIFMLSLFLVGGCDYFSKGNVDLDNAGEEVLLVSVDELTYKMNPGGYLLLDLVPGFHILTVKDENGKELETETFEVVEGGLINLARAEYYVWADLYGDQSLKDAKLNQEWVEIELEKDGKKIEQSFWGEIAKVDAEPLYVEKNWDYGLSEEFPGRLWGWEITEEKYEIKKKLFRKMGLIDAYMDRVDTGEEEAEGQPNQ